MYYEVRVSLVPWFGAVLLMVLYLWSHVVFELTECSFSLMINIHTELKCDKAIFIVSNSCSSHYFYKLVVNGNYCYRLMKVIYYIQSFQEWETMDGVNMAQTWMCHTVMISNMMIYLASIRSISRKVINVYIVT